MIKKISAALMAMIILGGLAYYSGILYSEKTPKEEQARLKALGAGFLGDEIWNREIGNKNQEEPQKGLNLARQEVSSLGDRVLSETKAYRYYLVEEQGYVNIYLEDRTTLFEYTNITLDMLPADLRTEILEGKGLSDERELYDFLENYSS